MLEKIMHETAIAKNLALIVLETAADAKLEKVSRVSISLGKLVQIMPDIFEFAFRAAVKDTIACDAFLDIEIVDVLMRCRTCGSNFSPEDNTFLCRNCKSSDIDIVHGRELFVKNIEGE